MSFLVLIFMLYLKLSAIFCESQCKNFQNCSSCISYEYEKCVWCTTKEHVGFRCNSKLDVISDAVWCKNVYDPKETIEILSSFNDETDESQIVQFEPKDVKIKARINVPININFSYMSTKNPSLEVYFLLDPSEALEENRKILYADSIKIYKQLHYITNNIKLGVGSFVHQPRSPHANLFDETLYSFKHHQSLTSNVTHFSKTLEKLQKINGSNDDETQGHLDALMQIMVCPTEIGWSSNSLRIILLMTGSTYHSAGDGKIVGTIRPNDMMCHLEENEYKIAYTYDYPSVRAINKIATETNTRIIFASKPNVRDYYRTLQKYIKNAKHVPLLRSFDLFKVISIVYDELFNVIQLETNIKNFMTLTLETGCKGKCPYKEQEPVNINTTLILTSCPENRMYSYDVRIGPKINKEKSILHVEVDCQCDCEKPDQSEKDSEKCNKAGTYQCGICNCNKNRYGDTCNNSTETTFG